MNRAIAGLVQGVTAASSGTHRRWWEEQASSLSAGCGGYRRGAAEIPAGSP